jgi:hypothetical protein
MVIFSHQREDPKSQSNPQEQEATRVRRQACKKNFKQNYIAQHA